MDKDAVVHIYNGVLLSHKKEHILIYLMRRTKLEPVIKSELSQKDKCEYRILTHIYGVWRDGTDEFIFRAAVEEQT